MSTDHPHVITNQEEALIFVSVLEKINSRAKRSPCFNGIRFTIATVTSLMDQENDKYIITTRLSQDPIESLKYPAKRRLDRNPTVRAFRSTLRLYCLKYINKLLATSGLQPSDPDVFKPAAQVPMEIEGHSRID